MVRAKIGTITSIFTDKNIYQVIKVLNYQQILLSDSLLTNIFVNN